MLRQIRGKRGAEMTVGTLVIIVLAIVVLVVLAIGFGTGWGNLWDKIKSFFGGGENIDTVVQSCNLACNTNSQYAYCSQQRDVRSNDKTTFVQGEKYTCKQLETMGIGLQPCSSETLNCGRCGGTVTMTKKCTEIKFTDKAALNTTEVNYCNQIGCKAVKSSAGKWSCQPKSADKETPNECSSFTEANCKVASLVGLELGCSWDAG